MFDSLLNSKFYNKCKHAFKCIRTRLVPIQRKKQAMIRFLKKDVADLLANGLDTHAFGRMDGLIIEMNHASCYDMIEHFCEYIGKQLSGLQKQRDCPQEAREAVSTLIFAAARFPDLPELCDLRHIFTERYGNLLEPFVSLEFVQKLDNKLFINEEKLQAMQSIAEEFSVGFDTKALEIKLWTAPETEHDLFEKDSVKQVEPAMPMSNKQEEDEDAPCERKSEATPVGHKQKLEAQLKPKDVQAVASGIGRLNENTRRQHSDKSVDKEHLEKSVSPLDMKGSNTKKGVQKANKKDVRPCEKELMEAVELDLNGLPKQGLGSVKLPETDSNKIVPLNAKPKEAKKEHGVEKENGKGLGYHHRPRMPGGPDHTRRHADSGLKALGLENQGLSSVNPSNGNTTNRTPPYAKLNGAKGNNRAEKEVNNGFLHDRPQHLADLEHPVEEGQQVPESAAYMQPPYVKPKFNMQPEKDDPAKRTASHYSKHNIPEQTDHLADMEVLRPVSVRRKKPPAPVDAYGDACNNEVKSRTPSSHRRHSIRQKGANDDYDRKVNGIDDVVGNGKNVQRTPSSRPRHSGRRNGALYNDDYEGFMQRRQADKDETAIDFGNLLPQTANGHRRLKSRNTNVQNGDDEEERTMDKLLMHYSKKGLDMDEAKTRTETKKTANGNGAQIQCQQNGSMHPPGRAVSLPPESASPDEEYVKVPARSTSLQPDCPRSVRVHPRMPDFDELAARVIALRKA